MGAEERASTTAAWHEEVRKEAARLAQEVRLSRAAKIEAKNMRTEIFACEAQRIANLRKGTNIVAEKCMASMKEEILQQRVRSVFDAQALKEHMASLLLASDS